MASKAQIIEKAESWWEEYKDRLSTLLGIPLTTMPKFVVKDLEGDTVAATDAATGIITIDPSWNLTDGGLIIHEATHYLQNIANPDVPSKYVEAIADAARMKLGLTEPGWTPSTLGARLADLHPWQLQAVSTNMQSPDFDPQLLNGIEDGTVTKDSADVPGNSSPWQGVFDVVGKTMGQVSDAFLTYGGTDSAGGLSPEAQAIVDALGLGGPTEEDTKKQERDLRNSYLQTVSTWGLDMSNNVMQLVKQGAAKGYSVDTFLSYLRQTPEYHQAFRGIFDEDGNLKFSETTYLSYKSQFNDIASQAGLNVGPGKIGWFFKNDVTPSEFADRAEAVKRLQRDDAYYKSFAKELVDNGVATPREVSREGLLKFVLGVGNKAWYDLNQDIVTRYSANEAGIAIGKNQYSSITQKLLEKISGKGLSEEAMAQGFAEVGQHLLSTLPLSKIQGYSLTKSEIAQASFGGPKANEVRQKIQHIVEQEDAFYQDRATTGVQAAQGGGAQIYGGAGTRAGQ